MARYDSVRKTERNRLLLEYRKANPEASLAEIGRLFNISKQRVSEILQKEGNKVAAKVVDQSG